MGKWWKHHQQPSKCHSLVFVVPHISQGPHGSIGGAHWCGRPWYPEHESCDQRCSDSWIDQSFPSPGCHTAAACPCHRSHGKQCHRLQFLFPYKRVETWHHRACWSQPHVHHRCSSHALPPVGQQISPPVDQRRWSSYVSRWPLTNSLASLDVASWDAVNQPLMRDAQKKIHCYRRSKIA